SAGGPSQVSIGGTYSAEIDYCTIQHGQSGVIGNHVWGANNLSDDPLLVPFTAGLISTVSPCIDRGTNTPIGGLNSHDWIGTLIPTDGDDDGFSVADIGAAEFDPHRPILTVPTTPLEFFDRVGGPNPAPQIIRLRNAGAVSMDWSVTSNCAEIVISPPRGQADREEDEIVVEVDTSQWPRGVYTCTLTVSAAGAINSPVSIPVTVSMGGTLRVPADIGTIQAAIDASLPGDEILLADGVFRGPGNRDLQIGDRRLTIRSASGIRENCVIDCEYASRGITFGGLETPETTIADLTITRGALTTRSATGAAVHVGGADPTIRNVQFKDNRLYGIFSRSATISGTGAPRLIDCQIETSASLGYGGAVELGVDAIVEHCTFERNKNHGTLLSVGAGSIVRGCRFIDNEMTTMLGHGGDGAPLQIERCYFERCVGEAVYATGTARLANCVIFDCEAPERLLRGVSGATVEVVNCTVIGNRVSGTTLDGFLGGSVTNSIFRNIAQRELQPGIVTTYSNVLGGVEGEGNINADALAAFARNAHLMPGSPCIDAGTNAPPGGLPTGDFDGYPRVSPANGIADIGAYEFPGDQALLATDQQELSISIMRDVPIATTTLNIRNAGVGAMDWVIASGCNWATAQPNSGGSDGEIDMVRIVCDAAALSAGEHSCEITIDAPGARLAPRTIGLTLRINSVRRVPQDYATIQAALDTATNGDIVELSDGQYSGPGNTELTFHGRLVHLRSASNDASRCVIDGDGTAALLVLDQREPDGASVENITLRNSGGGARAISLGMLANLRLRNCVVEDNTSGAINLADQSSLSLERCVVRNNSASQGGAIRMLNYASATWDDCVFQGNLADIGAVLHSNTGATVAHDCLIIDNRAQQGWFAWISGNYSALTLDGCTLANNRRTAPGQSALIFSEYRCGIRLWNTVSWFNDRPHAQGVWVDIVYVDYCDFEGGGSAFSFQTGEFDYGENNIESDPRFADVAAGDYRLTGSSPCVNAGDPGFEPAENDLDVFGNPRVAYRRIDMGAHEFRFPPGDMNCGGVVNNFDIDLFVLALTNPAAYEAAQPECDVRQADMNADGSVNNFDIDLFVDALDAG
ncbi:MAG: right-handed parallel beta-helix repeat-containing protein, partial [Phycisphaerales bacterium]|nr:right-handed parallel beta-helix repeat-containing protein [Phycisphaerales bacterium]